MDFVKLMSCFGCLAGDPTDIVAATREKNPELVKYFETLVHARFAGETSNIMDTITDHNEVTGRTNLGSVLCKIDAYIRNRADIFTGNESLFLEYLDQIAIHRCPKGQKLDRVKKKILRDKTRFVELYRRRGTGQWINLTVSDIHIEEGKLTGLACRAPHFHLYFPSISPLVQQIITNGF